MNLAPAQGRADPAPLPEGVTRDPYCDPAATLETCRAVRLYLVPPEGSHSRSWIVWRNKLSPRTVRIMPLSKERITELRAGDRVRVGREFCKVAGLEIWR